MMDKFIVKRRRSNSDTEKVDMELQSSCRLVTRGSFHQASGPFEGRGGMQCMTNALSAIAWNRKREASTWITKDMDDILVHGDVIYQHVVRQRTIPSIANANSYLLSTELPHTLQVQQHIYIVTQDEPLSGLLFCNTSILPEAVTLSTAIRNGLINNKSKDLAGCILVLREFAVAVLYVEKSSCFYVFDSHSRSEKGLFSLVGSSVLTEIHSIQALCTFLLKLSESLSLKDNAQFELIPISLSLIPECLDSAAEVSEIKSKESERVAEQVPDGNETEEAESQRSAESVRDETVTAGRESARHAEHAPDDTSTAGLTGNKYDIGMYIGHRGQVDDGLKYTLLSQPWKPDTSYKFPYVDCGKQRRCFKQEWLHRYSWLSYSEVQNGALCRICVLFAPMYSGKGAHQKSGKFVYKSFNNWKDMHECATSHASSQYHKTCFVLADNFLQTRLQPECDVAHRLNFALSVQERSLRKGLLPIVKTVIFCGRQGIALRGHIENEDILTGSNTNCAAGNFRALLRLRIDAGDADLRCHLENAPKNAQYTSPKIQNDIISICGELILSEIVQRINQARCFSILADETTDAGRKEQLAVCIRYVNLTDDEHCQLREDFIGFADVSSDLAADGIAKSIISILRSAGIDLNYCCGQGYDGASTMSGHLSGVRAIIRKQCPFAVYTHCASHCLNLCLSKACSVPVVRNALGVVAELVGFFNHSAARTRRLENVVELMEKEGEMAPSKSRRLKHLCETRWVERHESLITLMELFSAVVRCLEEMQHDSNTNTSRSAALLLHSLTSSSTVVGLATAERLSSILLPLTTALQSKSIDLIACCQEVDNIQVILREFRSCNAEFSAIFKSVTALCSSTGTIVAVPRLTGKQTHRSNCQSLEQNVTSQEGQQMTSPEETYYRINVFNPFVDYLNMELKERFAKHRSNVFLLQALVPSSCSVYEACDVAAPIFEMYGSALAGSQSVLEAEFLLWKTKWQSVQNQPRNAFDAFQQCPDHYPNIKHLLKILCTLPVTTASAERTFSVLRRLKTWLRSSMTEDRMTGLALLAISHDVKLCPEAVVDKFLVNSKRRFL